LVETGVYSGFPRHIAEKLVSQTNSGSENYFRNREDPLHLTYSRNKVTSDSRMTTDALNYLEKAGFRTAISWTFWGAYIQFFELRRDTKPQSPEVTSS